MTDPTDSFRTSSGTFFSVDAGRVDVEEEIDNQECRNRLSALHANRSLETKEKLLLILQLGADWLRAENGYLTQANLADGTRTITDAHGPHSRIYEGAAVDLSKTYSRAVLAESSGLAIEDAPAQGWKEDAAYEAYGFSSYVGAKVVVNGELRGAICFTGRAPRTDPFDASDAAAMALIVQTVEHELECRRHEDRLRQTSARLKVLFEESPNMINIHDGAGNLIVPNPRLCEKTGYSAEKLTRMKVWDLDERISPEEAYELWAGMEPGDRRRLEGRYRKKNDATVPVEVDLRCLELNEGLRYVAIARDVTDRKQREEKLSRAKEKAEEADRLKSAILANMNHEIQTPLTSIVTFSEMLENSLDGQPQSYASRILRVSKRLQSTLDSVLDLSRLDRGETDLPREQVALNAVARDVEKNLSRGRNDEKPELVVDLPDSPVTGQLNEDALYYICQNLVENAVKFTPEGGTVELRVREEVDTGILEIDDSGVGMRPERVPELFETFGQESEEGKHEQSRGGLGLPIVKRLIDALGGTIEVETGEGKGTCVTVRLPKKENVSEEGHVISGKA